MTKRAPQHMPGEYFAKLTVVNGDKGARVAKMCAQCERPKAKCRCKAQKSEAQPRTIVPAERMRFRAPSPMVKARNVTTMGVLAKGLPLTAQGIPPTPGSSPRWETPPVPDFSDIYFQPESDKRNKLARTHQDNRRRATAKTFHGMHGIHGEVANREPMLRYEPDETLSQPLDAVAPHRIANKKKATLVIGKKLERITAGKTPQESMYGRDDDDDDSEDEKKKKRKRKRRFTARRT